MADDLDELLQRLSRGELDVVTVAERIRERQQTSTHHVADVALDVDRRDRCGYPEVVYCAGKTPETVVAVFEALHDRGEAPLGTRVSDEQATAVRGRFPQVLHNPVARTLRLPGHAEPAIARVAIVTAGTSDRPVAEEALETLRWMGVEADLVHDVGVAGPHRLPEQLHRLQGCAAVVVVAGMEGALPSVVGGWVDCPVIAVPTSVGYGASLGGVAPLLSMLNSCAANVVVVNVDAGFKGGYVAGLVARRTASTEDEPDS